MLEPKAPPARNGPNTGCLAPGVRRRVNKKNLNQKPSLYYRAERWVGLIEAASVKKTARISVSSIHINQDLGGPVFRS